MEIVNIPRGATSCYSGVMSSVSQRDLRNDNAELIRRVEQGETFTITRYGVPVARLVPVRADDGPLPFRPATEPYTFADIDRYTAEISTEEIIDELRGER